MPFFHVWGLIRTKRARTGWGIRLRTTSVASALAWKTYMERGTDGIEWYTSMSVGNFCLFCFDICMWLFYCRKSFQWKRWGKWSKLINPDIVPRETFCSRPKILATLSVWSLLSVGLSVSQLVGKQLLSWLKYLWLDYLEILYRHICISVGLG